MAFKKAFRGHEEEKSMKRLTFLVPVVLALTACGMPENSPSTAPGPHPPATSSAATQQDSPPAPTAPLRIAVVPKGLVHQFWLTVKAGADAAGKELGAEILWKGPAKETEIPEQINIIEDMIHARVNAIVMAACDKDALVNTVKRAMDAKIPVVAIDSGIADETLPISFVATDNIAGAKSAAETLARFIGEKGKVGMIPFVPGAATSVMREQGFQEGMKAFPAIQVLPPLYSYSDVAKGMTAAEDMMTANPDLAGIFAANESGAMGAAQAIKAAGKTGHVKLVAFDAAEEEVNALKEGVIQALIVQNPFQMGYLGVKAAVDHLQGRPVAKRIDTGVTVVTSENLDAPEVQQLLNPLK